MADDTGSGTNSKKTQETLLKLMKLINAEQEKGTKLTDAQIKKQKTRFDNLKKELGAYQELIDKTEEGYAIERRKEALYQKQLDFNVDIYKKLSQQALVTKDLYHLRGKLSETENEILEQLYQEGVTADQLVEKFEQLREEAETRADAQQTINEQLGKEIGFASKLVKAATMWNVAKERGLQKQLAANIAAHKANEITTKGLQKSYAAVKDFITAFDTQIKAFEKATQLGDSYTRSVEANYKAQNQLGVSLEEQTKTHMALIQNVTDYTMQSEASRQATAKQIAVLGELGNSVDSITKGMQISQKAMGMTAEQSEAFAGELHETAKALKLPAGELVDKYAELGAQFAKLGKEGPKAFKELARVSKLTGIEIGKLLQLTNKFDTFEGAATQAGQLNAALGGNFVNAMDLMTETDPAERFKMLRGALDQTGLGFDEMSYYQRKFFTESMGLGDVSELAALMSGDMSALSGATQKTSADYAEQAEQAKKLMSIHDAFQAIINDNTELFTEMAHGLNWLAKVLLEWSDAVKVAVGVMALWKIGIAAGSFLSALKTLGTFLNRNTVAKIADTAATQQSIAMKQTEAATNQRLAVSQTQVAASQQRMAASTRRSSTSLLAFAAIIAAIGLSIYIAAKGVAEMAIAFKDLPEEHVWAFTASVLALTLGMALMIGILASASGPALTAGIALLPLAAVILAIGLSVAIAAVGIGMMATGMSLMFETMDIPKMIAFGVFIMLMAYAAPAIGAAGAAFLLLGAAVLGFAGAMYLLDADKMKHMAVFASSFADIGITQMLAFAASVAAVAAAINSIPNRKVVAMSMNMQNAQLAAKAVQGMMVSAGGSRGATTGGSGGSKEATLTINLNLDGAQIDQKMVKVVKNAQDEWSLAALVESMGF